MFVSVHVLQDTAVLRGAEGGEVAPQTLRKSSSSRSSRKSFRLDYRLEVRKKKKKKAFPSTSFLIKPFPDTPHDTIPFLMGKTITAFLDFRRK